MLDPRAQTLLKALVERYIAEGQPVGSRALSTIFRARTVARPRSATSWRTWRRWARRQPAYLGRPHSDAARLPAFRRHPADGAAARRRSDDHRLQDALQAERAAEDRRRGGAGAVLAVAVRRRGAHAAPRVGVPADRIPAPVGKAHPADHRDAGRRRAEPHAATPSATTRRRS